MNQTYEIMTLITALKGFFLCILQTFDYLYFNVINIITNIYNSFVSDLLLEHWTTIGVLNPLLGNHVRSLLMKKHKHKTLHKHMLKIRLPQIRSESQICLEGEEEDKESSNSLQGQANGTFYIDFF